MKKLLFILLLTPTVGFADDWVCRHSTDNTKFVSYLISVDSNSPLVTSSCTAVSGANTPAQRTLRASLPDKYIKVSSTTLLMVEKTTSEKNAADAAELATAIAAAKAFAKQLQDALDAVARYQRAIVKLTVDEINIVRDWTVDFKVEVASATNLANLQSRVATLPTLNPRTYSQAKTAIENLVDGE